MPASCLHIIQTKLSQNRAKLFLDVLSSTDIVVLAEQQLQFPKSLPSDRTNSVYMLHAGLEAPQVCKDLKTLSYPEFVELLAACAQSRTW